MKKDELILTAISGATGLALILYMIYNPVKKSAPSSIGPGYTLPYSGATNAPVANPLPSVSNIKFAPVSLPAIRIPNNNITVNMGSSLFPLFGYAVS